MAVNRNAICGHQRHVERFDGVLLDNRQGGNGIHHECSCTRSNRPEN